MLAMRQEFEKFKQGLRNEGRNEGRFEGQAKSILTVIQERGIQLSDETRQRILRCTDTALLELWLKRALVAQTADEVLRPIG